MCVDVGVCVCVYLIVLILSRVVLPKPLGQRFVLKGSGDAVLHLDFSQGVGGWHQLNHAWTIYTHTHTGQLCDRLHCNG